MGAAPTDRAPEPHGVPRTCRDRLHHLLTVSRPHAKKEKESKGGRREEADRRKRSRAQLGGGLALWQATRPANPPTRPHSRRLL